MKIERKISLLFLAFSLCLSLGACVPSIRMKQEPLTKGDMNKGSVVVGTVSNNRGDEGGKNFEFLGKVRGGYGNPFALNTESGRGIDVVLKEVAKTSLEHSGYSTSQVTGKSFRLDIDELNFWCDGYIGYKIAAEIKATLINPMDGKILVQKVIAVQKGFAIPMGYSPMYEAFDEVINDMQKQLLAFIQSQEFQNAAKS
ncbi:MAG: hypothetical protein WCQ50_11825 [Spirochaetota bacterium]